jgi:AraC-like DNA-binding protein
MSATRVADRDRIDRICRYMAENADRPILLPEAAAASNMSVPTFTRFFRKCTGRTFVEHLTDLRVGTACRLLVKGWKTPIDSSTVSSTTSFLTRTRKRPTSRFRVELPEILGVRVSTAAISGHPRAPLRANSNPDPKGRGL